MVRIYALAVQGGQETLVRPTFPQDPLNANDIRSLNIVTDVDGSEIMLIGAEDPRKPMLTSFNGTNFNDIDTLIDPNGGESRVNANIVDAEIAPTTGTRWWLAKGVDSSGNKAQWRTT